MLNLTGLPKGYSLGGYTKTFKGCKGHLGKNWKHIAARIQRLYLPINGKQRFCSNMAHLVGQRFNRVLSPHCQKLQVKATEIMTLKREIFSCVSRKHLELSPQKCFFVFKRFFLLNAIHCCDSLHHVLETGNTGDLYQYARLSSLSEAAPNTF